MKPLIGVTSGYDYEHNRVYIDDIYITSINKAGGIAIPLQVTQRRDILCRVLSVFDGFLISGGPDIDASYYGQQNTQLNGEISPLRDYMEVFLIRSAIKSNKPILGICRGIQVMNVAMGGELYQDISCKFIGNKQYIKHAQTAPKWYATHNINITSKKSWVYKSLNSEHARVNSFHHQAVSKLAPGFVSTSISEDGVIESIEYTNTTFAVGVQWHPERMWEKDDKFLGIFKLFVNNCIHEQNHLQ